MLPNLGAPATPRSSKKLTSDDARVRFGLSIIANGDPRSQRSPSSSGASPSFPDPEGGSTPSPPRRRVRRAPTNAKLRWQANAATRVLAGPDGHELPSVLRQRAIDEGRTTTLYELERGAIDEAQEHALVWTLESALRHWEALRLLPEPLGGMRGRAPTRILDWCCGNGEATLGCKRWLYGDGGGGGGGDGGSYSDYMSTDDVASSLWGGHRAYVAPSTPRSSLRTIMRNDRAGGSGSSTSSGTRSSSAGSASVGSDGDDVVLEGCDPYDFAKRYEARTGHRAHCWTLAELAARCGVLESICTDSGVYDIAIASHCLHLLPGSKRLPALEALSRAARVLVVVSLRGSKKAPLAPGGGLGVDALTGWSYVDEVDMGAARVTLHASAHFAIDAFRLSLEEDWRDVRNEPRCQRSASRTTGASSPVQSSSPDEAQPNSMLASSLVESNHTRFSRRVHASLDQWSRTARMRASTGGRSR